MKYLQTLCKQADVHLTLKYYFTLFKCPGRKAITRKQPKRNSTLYALHLLKAFIITNIIFITAFSLFIGGILLAIAADAKSIRANLSIGMIKQLRMALRKSG